MARTEYCTLCGSALSPEPHTSGCVLGWDVFPHYTHWQSLLEPGLWLRGSPEGRWSHGVAAGLAWSPFLLPEEGYDLPPPPPLTHGYCESPLSFLTAFRHPADAIAAPGKAVPRYFAIRSNQGLLITYCFLGSHSSYLRLYHKGVDFPSFTLKECHILAAASLLLALHWYLCI